MGESKIAIEKTVDMNQAAAFLRLLAAELEGTTSSELNEAGIRLHDFNKMKVRLIKREGGKLALTIKVKNQNGKGPEGTAEFTDVVAQDYRPFKQEIKATFAQLRECASQATLPPSELLSQFMAQSKRLIAFPGFGDPYYHDYWRACQDMEQAVKEGSAPAFQEKMATIATLKKACHHRFK
jgi:XXXCH domain-containing protein